MQLETEISVYASNFLPVFCSKKTDLLGELWCHRHETWLVDTHAPWRRLAMKFPEHRFVLGRTYCNEVEDLVGTLAKSRTDLIHRNVLIFETVVESDLYRLSRLDDALLNTHKPNAPRLSQMPREERATFNNPQKRGRVCDGILAFIPYDQKWLGQQIQTLIGKTRYQAEASVMLASYAYALTILKMRGYMRRKEEAALRRADENILNDTYLLQEALMLDCGVLTKDQKLKDMCKKCGVPLFPKDSL